MELNSLQDGVWKLQKRRLQYLGHIHHMDPGDLATSNTAVGCVVDLLTDNTIFLYAVSEKLQNAQN